MLLEHTALLPAHVPHVDRLEVEVLGPVLGLQTAVVAAGRVGQGGAAAGRHLAPRHAAGRGLARARVVGGVPVLQPAMARGLNEILTQYLSKVHVYKYSSHFLKYFFFIFLCLSTGEENKKHIRYASV